MQRHSGSDRVDLPLADHQMIEDSYTEPDITVKKHPRHSMEELANSLVR